MWYRFIFIIMVVCLSLPTNAQELREAYVPSAVVASFRKMYPECYVYEWEWSKKKQMYEAEFMHRGFKHEAFFASSGEWLYTEKELSYRDLPAKVTALIEASEYGMWKVDDIKEIENNKKEKFIVVEVERGKREVDLYFVENGGSWTMTPQERYKK
ncbi:MAG TPA: PepSY-like domain-containing protein [Flavobacteriales bacterium]